MSKQSVIIYTDGACSGNPGPGGYAAVLMQGTDLQEFSGREDPSTNQRMELKAAVLGLEHAEEGSQVILHSDSAYLVRAFRERWLDKWQKNGWQNAKGEPVANQDLWRELLRLVATRDVQWEKVAGHAGDRWNERCDELARAAISGKQEAMDMKKSWLLVLNKDENTVMYVDLSRKTVVKTVPVDKNPHEVVISPDGALAYVTNSGGNTLSVLDNRTMQEIKRIEHPDFHFPHGLAMTRDGQKLYLASTRSGKFFVFSLPDLEVRHVFATGQDSVHMVSLTPDERHAYIANIRSNTLTLFDTEKEEVLEHIAVGQGPEGVAVHPNGTDLYVANQHDDTIYVMNVIDHQVMHRMKIGTLPIRLVFSPDGHYALVPNRESGDLSIIDCSRPWEIKRIRVGVWPGGVVFDASGKRAYVANNKTNDISIIDMDSLKEIGRIDAGLHPDGIAYFEL